MKVADHRQTHLVSPQCLTFCNHFSHLWVPDHAVVRSQPVDESGYPLIVVYYVGVPLASFEAVYVDAIF